MRTGFLGASVGFSGVVWLFAFTYFNDWPAIVNLIIAFGLMGLGARISKDHEAGEEVLRRRQFETERISAAFTTEWPDAPDWAVEWVSQLTSEQKAQTNAWLVRTVHDLEGGKDNREITIDFAFTPGNYNSHLANYLMDSDLSALRRLQFFIRALP